MCETSRTYPGKGNPAALTTPGTCWPLPWDQSSPLLDQPWPFGAAASAPCCCQQPQGQIRQECRQGMAASPQDPLLAPKPSANPSRLCLGAGKTSGKSLSTQPAALAAPLTPVCAQCTPTHACASLCKCDSPSCTPAPPAIRLSVCPPPAPTEHPSLPPSLPPPPERFRSVSIDKSGALPRRRCNGAQRVRGCRGAQTHGEGVRGTRWIHA